MKQRKKIFAAKAVLLAVSILVLTGCGEKEEESPRTEVAEAQLDVPQVEAVADDGGEQGEAKEGDAGADQDADTAKAQSDKQEQGEEMDIVIHRTKEEWDEITLQERAGTGHWNVIGNYNEKTWAVQVLLSALLLLAHLLSYTRKVKWAAKFMLGVINLFIGIVFFAWYGTEPVQKIFALPLYLLCGMLFLLESWRNKEDVVEKPNGIQAVLLMLYLLYPAVSLLLGNSFPQMVTHIMPCPVISLRIAVYAGYMVSWCLRER